MLEDDKVISKSPAVLDTNSTSPVLGQVRNDDKVGNVNAIDMSELLNRDLLAFEEIDVNGTPRSLGSDFNLLAQKNNDGIINEQLNFLQGEIKDIHSKINMNLHVLQVKQEKNEELKERIRVLTEEAGVCIVTDESNENPKVCSCNSHCSIS